MLANTTLQRTIRFAQSLKKRRSGIRQLPRYLTYLVTFRCNARCAMCDSWRKPLLKEMNVAEIESIFDQLPQMDGVRLSGGEPFIRKDFPDIVALVQQRLQPRFLHITSNGFLTNRIVTLCENRDKRIPLQLLISVDAFGEQHDEIRGYPSAWEKVTKTLQELAPRRKELNLRLHVNQVALNSDALEHYEKLRDWLAPLGLNNHLVIAYEASATYTMNSKRDLAPRRSGRYDCFGRFDTNTLRHLFDVLEKDIKKYPLPERIAKNYYLDGIRARLLHEKAEPNPPCVALDAHLRLHPDGTIPVCQFNGKTIGDLRVQKFDEAWFGLHATQLRSWVVNCPGCWAECEVIPSAVYTGDILTHAIGRKRFDSFF